MQHLRGNGSVGYDGWSEQNSLWTASCFKSTQFPSKLTFPRRTFSISLWTLRWKWPSLDRGKRSMDYALISTTSLTCLLRSQNTRGNGTRRLNRSLVILTTDPGPQRELNGLQTNAEVIALKKGVSRTLRDDGNTNWAHVNRVDKDPLRFRCKSSRFVRASYCLKVLFVVYLLAFPTRLEMTRIVK